MEEYFWGLELAVLEIRNVFDDAQLSSFLNHTGLTHSRRLTHVPGERDRSFSFFLLKSYQLDGEWTSFSFALQLETFLQDDITFPHHHPFLFSYSVLSNICEALSELTGSLDLNLSAMEIHLGQDPNMAKLKFPYQ